MSGATTWAGSSTAIGERWAEESGLMGFVGRESGWALDFSTTVTDCSAKALDFGSPTTHGLDGGATVLFYAGTSSAAPPIRWFARSSQFAALAPSPS